MDSAIGEKGNWEGKDIPPHFFFPKAIKTWVSSQEALV